MLLKFKITEDFQHNFWSRDNYLAMNWPLHDYLPEINKFHFFKFIQVDNSDVSSNARYFPIFIVAGDVITQVNNFVDYVLNDPEPFLNKKLIPVFLDPLEGYHEINNILESAAEKIVDICQVYLIIGNKKITEQVKVLKPYYTNHWVHHVDMSKHYNIVPLYKNHKVYINLNRTVREHRVILLDMLLKNNLKDCGYNTWAGAAWGPNFKLTNGMYWKEYLDLFPAIEEHKPYDILDIEDIEAENPTCDIPVEHCMKSFLYIVTETHVNNSSMFISEKTYKPMRIGLPFIILGNVGTLKALKELGFKTFSEWIDESYDLDLPLEERCSIIVKEIKKFAEMTKEQRLHIRGSMFPVIKHNYIHLNMLSKTSDMYDALVDIKNKEKE